MSIIVTEVSIPSDAFAVGNVLHGHSDILIDLTKFVPTGQSFIPYFWAETEDVTTFEECVRSDDRVESLTALDTTGNRTLYKIEWAIDVDGFITTVAAHDLLIEDARGTEDRWKFRLRGYDRENFASFQQTLLDEGIPLHVHRIWSPKAPGDEPYGLTETQRETLELAFNDGYFDVPRNASLDDLGEQLDVSRQSVSRRIRQGVHNLLGSTLMDETDPASNIQ